MRADPLDTAYTPTDAQRVAEGVYKVSQAYARTGKVAAAGAPVAAIRTHDAAYGDLIRWAYKTAMDESDNGGGLVATSPEQNSPANASTLLGQIENSERPEGYATVPMGGANIQDTPSSAIIGTEMPAPGQDAGTVAGGATNSLQQVSDKEARARGRAPLSSLERLLRKVAEGESDNGGGLVATSPEQNSPANASTLLGQIENSERPEGYATVPMGGANIQDTPSSAILGTEMPAPGQDAGTVAGGATNSLQQVSDKEAADRRFLALSAEILPWLPRNLTAAEKVAECQAYVNASPSARLLHRSLRAQESKQASARSQY